MVFRYFSLWFSTVIKRRQQAIIIYREPLSEKVGWGLQQCLKHVYMSCLSSSILTCHKLKFLTLMPENCAASLSFLPDWASPKEVYLCPKLQGWAWGPYPAVGCHRWITVQLQMWFLRGSICLCLNSSGQHLEQGCPKPALITAEAYPARCLVEHCGRKKKK